MLQKTAVRRDPKVEREIEDVGQQRTRKSGLKLSPPSKPSFKKKSRS